MSATDYLIDLLLVGIVLRQIRLRALTTRSLLLPAALLALAGAEYLKGFPTAGNDIALYVVLIAAGAACGLTSGLTTNVWRTSAGAIMCRAGGIAAAAWILGMGIRFGFDVWAHTDSAGRSLVRFSIRHSISSGTAWTAAFVLMAFAEVLSRLAVIHYQRIRLSRLELPVVGA
jgi:NADH:ubiquinone oxidoreductase subunit K